MKLSVLVFVIVICGSQLFLFGQETSPFKGLTAKYEAAVERVESQYGEERDTLTNRFLNAWLQEEKAMQKSGDLEGYLAAKKERTEFMEGGSLGSGGSARVMDLREVFKKSLGEINQNEYREKVSLNTTYIEALERMTVALTKANNIDEAVAVKDVIEKKTAENAALLPKSGLEKPPIGSSRKKQEGLDMETFLVGKRFVFPRPDGVDTYYSFHSDGKAFWHGPGNQAVERAYEPTGKARQVFLWWPARGKTGIGQNLITFDKDGVNGEIYEMGPDRTTKGQLSKSK